MFSNKEGGSYQIALALFQFASDLFLLRPVPTIESLSQMSSVTRFLTVTFMKEYLALQLSISNLQASWIRSTTEQKIGYGYFRHTGQTVWGTERVKVLGHVESLMNACGMSFCVLFVPGLGPTAQLSSALTALRRTWTAEGWLSTVTQNTNVSAQRLSAPSARPCHGEIQASAALTLSSISIPGTSLNMKLMWCVKLSFLCSSMFVCQFVS